jgi:hypothetical protein
LNLTYVFLNSLSFICNLIIHILDKKQHKCCYSCQENHAKGTLIEKVTIESFQQQPNRNSDKQLQRKSNKKNNSEKHSSKQDTTQEKVEDKLQLQEKKASLENINKNQLSDSQSSNPSQPQSPRSTQETTLNKKEVNNINTENNNNNENKKSDNNQVQQLTPRTPRTPRAQQQLSPRQQLDKNEDNNGID